MRNHHLILMLTLLALAAAAPLRAGPGPDSLWAKAVALYEANANWVPGSVYVHMQEVDKHGEPKDDRGHEVWTRLYLNEEGELEDELVRMLDDGEDVTEEEKAKREEEEAEREEDDDGDRVTMEGYVPFDPEHQDGITIRPGDEEDVVDGRRYAVYEFEDERENEDEDDDDEEMTVKGKVWLDVETGIPLRMVYTTDPLPKRVKKMVTSVTYEYGGPDSWQAKTMSVKATGGILFIKKHFHMNMTFDDHWRMPEEEDETDSGPE
jgi:hypothetical protein